MKNTADINVKNVLPRTMKIVVIKTMKKFDPFNDLEMNEIAIETTIVIGTFSSNAHKTKVEYIIKSVNPFIFNKNRTFSVLNLNINDDEKIEM